MTISRSSDNGGRPLQSPDLLVVVPGIMGTELVERSTGRRLWGLPDPIWYTAWRKDGRLAELALLPAERDAILSDEYLAETSRIVPGRLLRWPVAMPVLRGVEPYTDLITDLCKVAVHCDAVVEFGYDWRLPVSFNARLLADTIKRRLAAWRTHEAYHRAMADRVIDRAAQVVIVAHSMGGLLAQELSLIDGATDDVRLSITLGTPFHGSVKGAELVNSGRGTPIFRRNAELRDVVATMPGVHDLLPWYRCQRIETPSVPADVVHPSASDLIAIGADPELLDLATRQHQARVAARLVNHRALIGTEQPTAQSMTIARGVVQTAQRSYDRHPDGMLKRDAVGQPLWTDAHGDSTVYYYAATLDGVQHMPIVQSHGGLAKAREARGVVRNLILDRGDLGAKLGAGDLGLDVPDVVTVDERFEVSVRGEVDPGQLTVKLTRLDEDGDIPLPVQQAGRRPGADALTTELRCRQPGLYRVSAKTGGSDPVTQLVICAQSDG